MQDVNVLFTTWKSYDRVQSHGADEKAPTALEEALPPPRCWMSRSSGWACQIFW